MPARRAILAALILLVAAAASAGAEAQGAAAEAKASALRRETRHLKFTATLSPSVVVPGQRLTVAVDIVPKPGMHVYAPGSKYRPIKVTLEPQPRLKILDPVYPPPSPYYFKPLNETVPVYQAPFRLLVEIIAGNTEAEQKQLRSVSTITLKGALEYQACDDRVCYLPESIPLRFTLKVLSAFRRTAG